MAKVSLKTYLNAELKKKGIGVKAAQKNAGKYKSIKAAKAAGSLYYTNKNGKVMAAVYAEDLDKKPVKAPKDSKITTTKLKPGQKGDLFSDRHEGSGPASKNNPMARVKKITNAATEKSLAESKFDTFTRDQQKTVQNRVTNGMTRKNAIAKTYADSILEKPPAKTSTLNNKGGMITKKKPAAAKMMGGGMAKKKGASMYNKGGAARKK